MKIFLFLKNVHLQAEVFRARYNSGGESHRVMRENGTAVPIDQMRGALSFPAHTGGKLCYFSLRVSLLFEKREAL